MEIWRQKQKESFTKLSILIDFLELDEASQKKLALSTPFPLLLPRRLAEKIPKNSIDHPLALQFLPLALEEIPSPPGYSLDPVEDKSFEKCPKLLHKYNGRALIVTTGACAMHCRYCFRKNFDYGKVSDEAKKEQLEYLQKTKTVHEVCLSGGDPLSLSDSELEALLETLSSIDHIELIRFHTRFPMGIPERITESFLSLLKKCRKQIIFVIHANHPDEFDEEIFTALKQVASLSIPILCQTVLLRGVNDSFETLKRLFLLLASRGILPYYLHQLDLIQGSHHFLVPVEEGKALIERLRSELPGYAVPRYVAEIPSRPFKTLLS